MVISPFVSKTSLCSKMNAEADTQGTRHKHKQGLEPGRGNEAMLRLQHLCWRERLGMTICSSQLQSCWRKRCGELETALKIVQLFELALASAKQNNPWPGNCRGGQNNNMDVRVTEH